MFTQYWHYYKNGRIKMKWLLQEHRGNYIKIEHRIFWGLLKIKTYYFKE